MTEAATGLSVDVRVDDGVLVVTLDDGKVNALNESLINEVLGALERSAETALPIVLAGRPGVLSAGLDLNVVRSDDPGARTRLMTSGQQLYASMLRHVQPVVVACTGHALAGGAFLLLCADYRVGPTQPAEIGITEVSIGLALSSFVASIAEQRLPRRHLIRATVLAERYSPDEAVDAGFLDEISPDPIVAATGVARQLAALDATALHKTRDRIYSPLLEGASS